MSERKGWRAVKGCSEIREKLSAMTDGMLTPDEIRAVEEHIANCSTCATALEDMRKVVGHLQTLEQVEPPPWMTQKVMAKVRSLDTVQEKKGFFSWLFQPSTIKVPLGALATVVLAVTAYFIFEGIISDMPIRKTEPVTESRQQTAVESVPADLPEKSAAPARSPEKTVASQQAAEKKPVPGTAPPQRRSVVDGDKKDRAENRLWKEEEPIKSRAEAPAPAPKREYKTAPSVAPPALSAAKEPESRQTEALSMSKRAGTAGISSQDQYDKAGSAPVEYAPRKAKKAAKAFAQQKSMVYFHVEADDPSVAAARIITVMKEFRGSNIRKEIATNKTLVKCGISAVLLDRFFDRLKKAAHVREKKVPAFASDDSVLITVEIVFVR
jgi:hypothetical protein